MLDRIQLGEIERRMEDEHRKDREALERLKRFLPVGDAALISASMPSDQIVLDPIADGLTLQAKIEEVCQSLDGEEWTNRKMLKYLRSFNFPLKAAQPQISIGTAMGRLAKKGKLCVVRRGAGNVPTVYKWRSNEPEEEIDGLTDRQGDVEF